MLMRQCSLGGCGTSVCLLSTAQVCNACHIALGSALEAAFWDERGCHSSLGLTYCLLVVKVTGLRDEPVVQAIPGQEKGQGPSKDG